MSQYYILSLAHSPSHDGLAVWWRPNAAGYTTDLAQAGLYTEDQVTQNAGYYDNGVTTQAWRKKNAEAHAHRVANFNLLRNAARAEERE